MSNGNSGRHLDTLKKLYDYTKEENGDNEKQLEDLKRQLEDIKRKVDNQKKKCEQSKKRMQDAKVELEQAEKSLEVIDLATEDAKKKAAVEDEDEIEALEQKPRAKESSNGKRRLLMLPPSSASTSTLRQSVGRTRDQLNKSVAVGKCLSGSKFAMSCFGSQTNHGRTKITFLVLNDEWNELVTSSEEDQLLYVATGPSLKRSAFALAEEDEAIPFFHAPKKRQKTRDIFYVGHWKSVCHTAYQPPIDFMGTPRQILIRLQFVRYDETLDSAIAAS